MAEKKNYGKKNGRNKKWHKKTMTDKKNGRKN